MAGRTGALQLWAGMLVRRAGWLTAGLGVVLLVLGWYGVSGQSVVAQQLPYLASASIPGAALVIGGLVLAGAERVRRRAAAVDEATARRIAELHRLLVEPISEGEHGSQGEHSSDDGRSAAAEQGPDAEQGP
ncbi:MAG TPA: hypothetical protein VGM10_25135 [Actinocrinis sp.]|jgi:hypothetical protein